MSPQRPPHRVPPRSAPSAEQDPPSARSAKTLLSALSPQSPETPEAATTEASTSDSLRLPAEEELERLENQFTLLKDQLRQTQRLASIGTAAAMLAHEFNNLFTPVVSYAQYALDQDDPELMRKALRTTLKQSGVITGMSDRILGLAMDEKEELESISVRTLINETIECLGRDLSKDGIKLVVDISDHLNVRGNANQLQQVFFNLILNARHAMLDGSGTLTIRAAASPDGRVEIHVADTGSGIRPEYLEHLFSPFFSTKRQAATSEKKGLGLGLAVTKDIVEEHNGTISVQSALNRGTTFTVALPAAE